MAKSIDYYFTPGSPWAYLGHERLKAIAAKHGATVHLKPMDLSKIFPISGGLPLAKRSPQRQAYRLVELKRWSEHLGLPIDLQSKFAGASADLATRWILAAAETDRRGAMDFLGGVFRARWVEGRDIADPGTLATIARNAGLDAKAVAARAEHPEIAALYEASSQEAIDAQVFGAPWYVVDGEPFWGQDRLDFLDRALAK